MDEQLQELCRDYLAGQLSSERLLRHCLQLTTHASEEAHVDLQRAVRCGFPEVIFAEGKSIATLLEIVQTLHERRQSVLATRVSDAQQQALAARYSTATCHTTARTFRLAPADAPPALLRGRVAVITAGTSDLPVALEAQETLRWMNVELVTINDVGVAGPHRLPAHLDQLQHLDAAVVVAGMEGRCPVLSADI